MKAKSLPEVLMDKFVICADGCWRWTAMKTRGGYGRVKVKRVSKYAHRVVFEWLRSEIPEGLELDHLCRNRDCVNPDHLEPVTRLENNRRIPKEVHSSSRKTHCPQGHPYDEENTLHWKGQRRCKACRRDYKLRRKVAA